MPSAKVIKNDGYVAIRLPEGFDLEGVSEFSIQRLGDEIVLKPNSENKKHWDGFFKIASKFKGQIKRAEDLPARELKLD